MPADLQECDSARPRGAPEFNCRARAGGRRWWAHLAFTRINIELTFRKKEIEELMNVRGIGEKSFLKLKPLIVVTAKPDKPTAPQ